MGVLDGYLNGGYVDIIPFSKFGRNNDISTGVKEAFWNGGALYTGQPAGLTAERLEIFSSSASDVGKTIELSLGLDADGNLKSKQQYTLNGTSPILTAVGDTYSRMPRAKIVSSAKNIGQITIRHQTTTANVFAVMPAETKTTHIAAMTVPKGYFAIIPSVYAFLGKVTSGSFDRALLFDLEVKPVASVDTQSTFPVQINTSQAVQDYNNPVARFFDELTDIVLTARDATVSGTGAAGGFEGVLFPKAKYQKLYQSYKSEFI